MREPKLSQFDYLESICAKTFAISSTLPHLYNPVGLQQDIHRKICMKTMNVFFTECFA